MIIAFYGKNIISGLQGAEAAYEAGPNEVMIYTLMFTGIFPPILAIALSYDTIVGERTRRSLHLVLSKPIDRSSVYIGKFLAAFLSIAIVYLVVVTIGYLIVIGLSNQTPSLNEVGRAYAAIGVVIFSAACWVLFIMLFSTSFKTVTSTIIFSVLFWFLILRLISQSGLIYFLVTGETTDESITVDLLFSPLGEENDNVTKNRTTELLFWAHQHDTPIVGMKYQVYSENDSLVEGQKGSSLYSLFPTYILSPGKYTWTAEYWKPGEDSPIDAGDGSFLIGGEFLVTFSLVAFGDDGLFNDVILMVIQNDHNSPEYFDLTVTDKKDNSIVEHEENLQSTHIIEDLDKGDFVFTITSNNIEYFKTTIHSFGSTGSEGDIFGATEEDIKYPGYVKATYAMNPDNAATIAIQILSDDVSGQVILTVQEGIIALCLTFIILLGLGIFVFSRIELL
jgi:ABC-type transport system involved in multi-copper enzyme maturation permease subunit